MFTKMAKVLASWRLYARSNLIRRTSSRSRTTARNPSASQTYISKIKKIKARNQAGFKISLELFVFRFGGAERDRTADLLVANEALSQLSYSPPPDAHRTPLSQAATPSNDSLRVYQQAPPAQTSRAPHLRSRHPLAPAVPAASGFSTTCHTSPAASTTTPSTGTSNRAPLRATASSTPTSPARNSVRSSAICQRCRPATRDSSRISVTTAVNSTLSASTHPTGSAATPPSRA